jgi:hypothetical protein
MLDLGIGGPVQNRPFWTKVAKLVLGLERGVPLGREDRRDFWHRVAFYNFMQRWMPRARYPVSPELWEEAVEPFEGVMRRLQPQLLLVVGKRLDEHLPSGTQVPRVCINHPAAPGFQYSPWTKRIAEGIDAARRVG